jgi:hypothetical protein
MLLFEPNQSINEQYLAISWTEKVTEKIKALGMPDKEPSFVEV